MLGAAKIRIRPLKLGLLVDFNNAKQVREAIGLACSLWGGMFFPIIPLYKRMPASWREGYIRIAPPKEIVLGCIEAFDPDVLVQFSDDMPPYIGETRLQIIKPEDIWRKNPAVDTQESVFGISALQLLDDIYKECFKYKPKYPTKVLFPKIPKKLGLFWSSLFGEYPSYISRAIDSNYSDPLDIERPEITPEAFLDLMGDNVLNPRRITAWNLTRQGGLSFGRGSCVYFMDATSVEDIVDYWNLRATGRFVLALPKQFLNEKSFKKAVEDFLVRERRAWSHDSKHFEVATFIRSRNSTMEDMETYVKTLSFPENRSESGENRYFSLQHWYPRIWDKWARGKDGGVADIYGLGEESIDIGSISDLEMRLKPLLPNFTLSPWIRSKGLCANELDLRLYGADEHLAEVYPKVQGDRLASAISGIAGVRGEWRIGRHGLVKLVQNSWAESRNVPASETIFFAWLEDHGWKASLSPPGLLAKEIYKRLNGFPRLLADKSVLGLIEHMNGGMVSKVGISSPENRVTAQREIAVGEVKSRLKGKSGTSRLYDTLLEKGVFKLGLRTKCPNCQRNTWFPLSTLHESLDCPKCLNSFAAAGNIDQTSGGWYYRTAGPFSVPNYAEGAYTVLMTLDALGARASSSRRTTSVPSFIATSAGKRDLEADFAMFWREESYGEESEGLLFGECKTYGLFETKDIERMRYLADTFPGAVLVFSTLRQSLTAKEIAAIRRLAKAGRKYWKADRPINPVLILTGTELFDWQRPPFCWDQALQERFQHVHDLLSLCDATQQLYLNLPSWQEDWSKRWDKRSKRHVASYRAGSSKKG